MIHNQKGFALVMTMALLPFVIAGFFLAWSTTGFIQQDLALKHACREEGLKGQKKVAPLLEKLLKLNPEATKLKAALEEVDREIAFAVESNPAALPPLYAKRLSIQFKRTALDIKQKRLIQESNSALSSAHNRGRSQLQKNLRETTSFFIELELKTIQGSPSKLAVRPDYSDTAPTYSPVPGFANEQALAHQWQYRATVGKPFSLFLPGSFEFQKACAVTLQKEFTKWSPQIIKGSFSLKSVW